MIQAGYCGELDFSKDWFFEGFWERLVDPSGGSFLIVSRGDDDGGTSLFKASQ